MYYFFLFSAPPFPPTWNEKEVNHIIENIENKMFIRNIKNFFCKYNVINDLYFLYSKLENSPEPEIHNLEEKEIAWIGKITQPKYFYHSDFYIIPETSL